MSELPSETVELLKRIENGDQSAVNILIVEYRDRLRKMVQLRLDRRLQSRVDASDVVQDGFVDVLQRLPDYLANPRLPLYLWLRLVVGERLLKVHRHHFATQARDPQREVRLYGGGLPQADSHALAEHLLCSESSPSQAAIQAERLLRLEEALNHLEPMDREIVSLRHFEDLSREEAAQALGIRPATAAKRYVRAMQRLRVVMNNSTSLE